jgi:NADH:ubiquinone oxidoreductase subunit 4 (subunit M)
VQIACGVFGVVITAVYMLRVVRGTFFGESKPAFAHVRDVRTAFARLPYAVLVSALLIVGCWPKPMLRLIETSARPLIQSIVPETPSANTSTRAHQ